MIKDQKQHFINLIDRKEAKAFMKFLIMERNRHKFDLNKINEDICQLHKKWDIPIPAIPDNLWVKV